MKRQGLFLMLALVLTMALTIGAGAACAGQFAYYDAKIAAAKKLEAAAGKRQVKYEAEMAKAQAETAANDADEKRFAAGAAKARMKSDAARAKQDRWLNPISYIPPVGMVMAQYSAGEMDFTRQQILAFRNGQPGPGGCASGWGFRNVLFKVPAGAPECMAFYFVNRLFANRWNQLDAYTVFTEYGRPEWVDLGVIGTKVFFGIAGAGAGNFAHHVRYAGHVRHLYRAHDALLPSLGHTSAVGQSFLWQAAGGGSANLVAGAADQYFTGAYKMYQPRLNWFNGHDPLPTSGL